MPAPARQEEGKEGGGRRKVAWGAARAYLWPRRVGHGERTDRAAGPHLRWPFLCSCFASLLLSPSHTPALLLLKSVPRWRRPSPLVSIRRHQWERRMASRPECPLSFSLRERVTRTHELVLTTNPRADVRMFSASTRDDYISCVHKKGLGEGMLFCHRCSHARPTPCEMDADGHPIGKCSRFSPLLQRRRLQV